MCGIVGFLVGEHQSSRAVDFSIEAALETLTHRGPDGSGVWSSSEDGTHGYQIALGQRRLAVIDLTEGGRQPMHRGHLSVVFNGEIYNYKTLRTELTQLGHSFVSESDTEVLLAAVSEWGPAQACKRVDGMFAFGIVDRQRQLLWLGRDRFGEKPLYLLASPDGFGFGSELRSLRLMPGFVGGIDPAAFTSYVRTGVVGGSLAIHPRTAKLPPGSLLRIDLTRPPVNVHELHPESWWSPVSAALEARNTPFAGTLSEAADALDDLLIAAAKSRAVADVAIGTFLSGGVDSSSVVAALCASSTDVRTFTIGSDLPAFNEANEARAIANHLGTRHTELIVTSSEAQSVVPRLADMFDEPFADSSQIPTFLVSQMARRDVTVALSGDAGDEIFGGYNRYTEAAMRWPRIEMVPAPLRSFAARSARMIPPRTYDRTGQLIAKSGISKRFSRGIGDQIHKTARVIGATDANELFESLVRVWNPATVMLQSPIPHERSVHPSAASIRFGEKDLHPAETMMLLDTIGYLHDDILTKVDRAAMATSLETRAPFLTPELFTFAWTLPLEYRVSRGRGKLVLREVLAKRVPRELIEGPKNGFGVPIGAWLRGPLRTWAEHLLDRDRLEKAGLFDVDVVRTYWDEHLSGNRNWQHQLWTVLMFEAWRDRWDSP